MPDLVQVTSPSGVKFTVAKEAADAFTGFLAELEGGGYKLNQATSGGYNPRNIAGTNTPSQHSFGRAIDINSDTNPQGAKGGSDLPPNVADLATAHGLTWGGTWSGNTRDPMHFELSGKPAVAEAAGPSVDDLAARIKRLQGGAQPDGGQAAPEGDTSSVDALKARIQALQQVAPPKEEPPPAPTLDEYGREIGPNAPATKTGANFGPPPDFTDPASVRNWLQPEPGAEYGNILPTKYNPKTDRMEFGPYLPNMLRSTALGFVTPTSEMGTVDPVTGGYGADPNALAAALALGPVHGMRFGDSLATKSLAERELNATGRPLPETPPLPAPDTPATPGEVQPAGAQVTPPVAAARTAREISHGNTVADEEWLTTPQQPGVRDARTLVEGNTPTLAEQEQTVETARELKRLRNEHTEVSQEERQLLHDASENRKTAFKEAVPSDLTLNAAEDAAGKKIESDLQNTWANKGTADPDPVKAQIATELKGSAGHLPPMKAAMQQIADSLEEAGNNPQDMYKTHRLINFLQSKEGMRANPGYGAADVQAALTRVKGELAGQIDKAAPGFSAAMKTYSDTIGPIRAAQALNERYKDLFDSRGYMNFNRFHELMKDVIDAGHPDAPTNDLRGISDFQLQRLKDIHDDLRRSASAQDLAKAYGSDTAQNVMDIIKGVGKTAGSLGVRGAAAYVLGPAGPFAVDAAGRIMGGIRAKRGKAAGVARGQEILRPSPPTNPLN